MMISTPAPIGAKPAPAAPAAPAPAAPPAAAPTAPVAAGTSKPPAAAPPAQGQQAPPAANQAAAKAQVIDKLMKTTAADAMAQVDSQLTKVASLTVGGGTPEGTQGAKVASALLTDSSMMLQHAHMKAMEQIRNIAGELHIKLMTASSGLAYMGGQVAIAGQSKQPVKLAEIAARPIAETKATMAEVITALGGAKPAQPAAAAGPAAPAPAPAPAAARAPAPAPAPAPASSTPSTPGKAPNPA